MERPVRFRCLAGLLAACGGLVGFTAFSLGALRDPMNLALFIVPNGILTVAFIIRCVYVPRDAYRRALWRASAIVHGIWLAVTSAIAIVLTSTLKGTMEIGYLGAFWFAWLILAVALSFYGLRYDDSRGA
jgi:hypothetical protein